MRARSSITFAIIASVALIMACSGSPATCPEMGIITSVEEPTSPLNIDNRPGSEAPDFIWQVIDCESLETIDKTLSLGDFQGKSVIIIFHKSMGCPGCKKQMPYILGVCDKRTDTDLAVLTIYREDSASKVKGFVTSQGYVFPALADPQDEVAERFGYPPRIAPITLIVDAKGTIKAERIGALESQEELESMLNSQ